MLSRNAPDTLAVSSGPEAAPDRIASQRQRQPGDFQPPLAQVHNALQAGFGVGQLAFVDDEASFVFAFHHLRDDLIEGHDLGLDSRREKPQRQVSGGQRARDRNLLVLDFARGKSLRGHDHGAIAVADAASAGQQSIVVLNVGIGVERDGGHVIHAVAFPRLLIQSLNVAKRVGEAQPGDAHLVGGQRIEHESVVGVGTVRDADFTGRRTPVRRIFGFRCGCGGRISRRGFDETHACSLRTRCHPVETPAANMTLITSANTNQ